MLRGLASVRASVRKLFRFGLTPPTLLHPIKLKLGIKFDHDVKQRILFRGYSQQLCPFENFSKLLVTG